MSNEKVEKKAKKNVVSVESVQAKIKELSKERYPFTMFAGHTIPKLGSNVVSMNEDQLVKAYEYFDRHFSNKDVQSEAKSFLGFDEVEENDGEEKTFMDYTWDEIQGDLKLRATQIKNSKKIAELEEMALILDEQYTSKKDKKNAFLDKLTNLLG